MMSDLNEGKSPFAVPASACWRCLRFRPAPSIPRPSPHHSLSNPYAEPVRKTAGGSQLGFDSGHRHRPRRQERLGGRALRSLRAAVPGRTPRRTSRCDGSTLDPILKVRRNRQAREEFWCRPHLVPHGLSVDPEGNVWVTTA